MGIHLLVGFLGIVCGFFSGLLGIGGGIILAPLLLYLPPLLGFQPLSMHTVAGLTIVQGLVACVSGVVVHKHFNAVSGRLTAWMGTAIFLAALLGGAGAGYVSQQVLLFIFGILALVAALLMFVPAISEAHVPTVENLSFSRWRALLSGSAVGLLGGMVGQGGSFILIPLMTSFVRIPTRIAIGSNLGIVLLSSVAGFLGKAFTGQIEWLLALPLLVTVIPAVRIGGILSHRMPVAMLRRILGVIIGIAAVRILISAF